MDFEPDLPVPISMIADKYFLFDINVVTWLRRTHNICGVMSGTLPQHPSQNVFLGLPMQIMAEEAQLLIDRGVGYLVDDAQAHVKAFSDGNSTRHADYLAHIRKRADQVSHVRHRENEDAKQHALNKQKAKRTKKGGQNEMSASVTEQLSSLATKTLSRHEDDVGEVAEDVKERDEERDENEEDTALFDRSKPTPTQVHDNNVSAQTSTQFISSITPTTTNLLLSTNTGSELSSDATTPTSSTEPKVANLPTSYPLYRYLNDRHYFLTPGLRFGCQYCVYPGDPLRFHSHFLAVGAGWDEEIDLMELVGGGRLGTGVKKGWLVGGVQPDVEGHGQDETDEDSIYSDGEGRKDVEEKVRCVSVEWAAM